MDDVKMRKELITREIMAELDKPEPNVKLLKMLRTEMKTIVFGEIPSNDMASIKAPSDEVPLNSLPLSKTNNTQPIIVSETNSQINNPIITDEVVASKLTADKMDRPTQMITSGGTEANLDDGNSNIKESYSGLSLGLYAGSLMILAGIGGLAISGAGLTALPLLVLMTIVFYVGGIMMKKSRSLRMASYAFVGTGMAMVPLIGVLIHNITSWNPNLVWLLTSLISVPIYIFAANIMKSKVLSYFAILGFASSACSLTATVSASVAWCFIAVMIVGLVFDSLALFGQTRHFGVMRDSVEQAGKWLPIATLLASTLAIQAISQLEYFIMISFVVVQLIANLSRKTNIINESALRIVLLIWLVVLVNMIAPNMQSVGIALAIGTLVEVIYSMTKIMKDKHISLARDEVETTCLILAMVLFIISGCLIGIPLGSNAIWGGTMVALLLNTALAILAHKFLKSHKWYIILTIIWLFLPIAFINTVGLKELWVLPVCLVAYLAETIAIEALAWNIEYKQANILTAAGTIMFCIASCVTSGVIGYQNLGDNTVIITAIIMSISATIIAIRGIFKKAKVLQELSSYCMALAVCTLLYRLDNVISFQLTTVIQAHIVFASFIGTSFIADKPGKRDRLLIGNLLLLVIIGILALAYGGWTLPVFMVEAVITLVYGLLIKYEPIWNLGSIAVGLSVLWFTRGLPFVWPVLLGVGVMGAVIFILLRRNIKKPK